MINSHCAVDSRPGSSPPLHSGWSADRIGPCRVTPLTLPDRLTCYRDKRRRRAACQHSRRSHGTDRSTDGKQRMDISSASMRRCCRYYHTGKSVPAAVGCHVTESDRAQTREFTAPPPAHDGTVFTLSSHYRRRRTGVIIVSFVSLVSQSSPPVAFFFGILGRVTPSKRLSCEMS